MPRKRKKHKHTGPKTAYQKNIIFLVILIGGLLLLLLVGLLWLLNHPFNPPVISAVPAN